MRTTGLFAAVFVIAKTCYGEPVPAAAAATTSKGVEEPSSTPILGAQIVQGCFSSQGELKFNSTPAFNSKSSCAFEICYASGKKVAGTSGGNECYCGDKYPPESTLVDDKKCNSPCAGYDQQACMSAAAPLFVKVKILTWSRWWSQLLDHLQYWCHVKCRVLR